MSINNRLTVLISALVLGVSLALGLFSINVIMRIIERDTAEWMVNEAGIGAELVSARITNYQQVLRTIAAMPVVQTMDRALQGPVILPLIEEMGFDDIAIIDLEANAWHVKGGSVPNLAARDYVKTALAGGMGLSSIMTSAQSAVPIPFPILNYTVPIVRNGQVIGAVLARTNALAFSDTMKSIKGKSGGYAYMINGTGTVVAHALRPETVDSAENFIEKAKTDPSAVPMANAMREMIEGKQGSLAYTYGGKDLLCGFTSVPGQDMYIVMSAERDALLSEVYSMRTIMFIIMGAAVLAGIGASVLLARSIAGPLGKMRDVLSKMGEGDLTSEAPARGNDEIAEIGASLNQSTGNVRSLVRTIKEQSASLSGIGDELAENMKKTETTARLITAGTEKIKTQFIDQDESVRKTSGIVEQISAGISSLSEFVEAQSASVSQSSSAIEEMLANVQSVTQTLIRNTENVEYLAQASEAGRNGLEEVSQNIQEIARESEGLLEINAVMENIASQTNLLSMNAAIEAAHAGEAGKGFAVVAGEIRKLAESSSTQSKTIAAVLKKIKSSIDKITVSTKAVLNRFQAINEGVETVARQEDLIRSSMEEQNAGSQQILEAVGQLNELTGKVKASSTNMLSGSREIIRECHNLERSTREISGGVSEMASGTEQINAAVNRVNGISIQNRESINRLTEDVSRFKIE